MLWDLHHEVSSKAPKLGEAVVFRNCFDRLEAFDLADEVGIELRVIASGKRLHYVPEALIYNHGATRISDFYRHRRRIHEQHVGVQNKSGYRPSTMKWSHACRSVIGKILDEPEDTLVACALIGVEVASRTNANLRVLFQGSGRPDWAPIESAKVGFSANFDDLREVTSSREAGSSAAI